MLAQSYTSYFTGDTADVVTLTTPGIVLMGGAGESDPAMVWMLERAGGGDILVLRASGEDGYNDYFFSELGVTVNSVETIVFHSADAATDAYVLQQIENCEVLWFAGGDQWDYISYWRDTPVQDKIQYLIQDKKITVGGTSAGCAVQGDAYFSAENGTVTSAEALSNPYSTLMTVGYDDFIDHPVLENTITDTHYDNPDRRGRHSAFLARLVTDYGIAAKGIGVDEYTAVCIDENNIAHVYGEYPTYDDFAYFIQAYCIPDNVPELCSPDQKLTWIQDNAAMKVAVIAGTESGDYYFDLNDWQSYNEVESWENWWVDNGILNTETEADPADCATSTSADLIAAGGLHVYPNPAMHQVLIENIYGAESLIIFNIYGAVVFQQADIDQNFFTLDVHNWKQGHYLILLQSGEKTFTTVLDKM